MAVSIEDQIRCVVREIGMRERVYARNVELKKMSQPKMDAELAAMRAVLATLQEVERTRLLL